MTRLRLPDTTIYYRREGIGPPPMVFVHGAQCDHRDWRHQLAFFARSREVIAPDLHGHGESAKHPGRIDIDHFASDVVELCHRLNLRKPVLVGHSLGCRVLLQATRIAPGAFAALVLVDGAYLAPRMHGDHDDATRARLAVMARERVVAGMTAAPLDRLRRGFGEMFFDARFDTERDTMIARAAALPPHVAHELMPGLAAWDVEHLERALAGVPPPVLAISSTWMSAEHRRVQIRPGTSTPWLDALRRHAPHTEIVVCHGSGHFVMLERPDDVNREIEEFLVRHGIASPKTHPTLAAADVRARRCPPPDRT